MRRPGARPDVTVISVGYVLERLRSDSRHVIELSNIDGLLGHPGVKGRFRELLVNNLLLPWLPSGVGCGTGVIIDHEQQVADAGQEDVLLFDPLLAPSIFASSQSTHGVYFADSVLCRIEVKSELQKSDLGTFVKTSVQTSNLRLSLRREGMTRPISGPLNMLVAFSSEVATGRELDYLREEMTSAGVDPASGVVTALCIADRGFWLFAPDDGEGRPPRWEMLRFDNAGDPLAYWVGVVSNSCFVQRAERQGWDSTGGGIGNYLEHPFEAV